MTDPGLPWVIAGDIFDRWDSSAELINLLLEVLPDRVFAVPGQHDLPHHRYEDRKRSAYWTLVEAGRVTNLEPDTEYSVNSKLSLFGFPWGHAVKPLATPDEKVNLAVIHAYIWTEGHCFPGVTEDSHLDAWLPKLKGFDAAVFGDNHRPFGFNLENQRVSVNGKVPAVYNHGTFMRRRRDEADIQPAVGILYSDGSIEPHAFADPAEFIEFDDLDRDVQGVGLDPEQLLELLRDLGTKAASFRDTLLGYLRRNAVGEAVQNLLITWLERTRGKP